MLQITRDQAFKGSVELGFNLLLSVSFTVVMSDPYLLCHTLDASTSVNCMSFSPTGDRLAVGGEDATIRVWNPQTGKLLHCVVLQSPILCLDWDPLRQSRIFFGCQDGTVAYIDSFVDEVCS